MSNAHLEAIRTDLRNMAILVETLDREKRHAVVTYHADVLNHAEALAQQAERLECAFCDTLNAYDIPYEPEHFCIEEGDIDVRRLKRDVYGGDLPDDDDQNR